MIKLASTLKLTTDIGRDGMADSLYIKHYFKVRPNMYRYINLLLSTFQDGSPAANPTAEPFFC